MARHLYLDTDTTPPAKGRYAAHPGLPAAKRHALNILQGVIEGQIGIYATSQGGEFHGYAIKYRGQPAYFETTPAEQKEFA